jgi:hypothetical protein
MERTADETADSDGPAGGGLARSEPLSRLVDWLAAAALVVVGLLCLALGVGLAALADREWLATQVADGTLTSDELTDAELVDVTHALLQWGGVGLAVTGLALAVAGVTFLLYRRRVRQRATDGTPDSVTLAIVGAAVTVVTSFVPFSPVLGGGVAGYLRDSGLWDGVRVGVYAGVVAAIPLALVAAFLFVGFVVAATQLGVGGAGVVVGVVVALSVLVAIASVVGLSGLGGYLGAWLAERDAGA